MPPIAGCKYFNFNAIIVTPNATSSADRDETSILRERKSGENNAERTRFLNRSSELSLIG